MDADNIMLADARFSALNLKIVTNTAVFSPLARLKNPSIATSVQLNSAHSQMLCCLIQAWNAIVTPSFESFNPAIRGWFALLIKSKKL